VSTQEAETQVWLVRHGETEWSKSGRHTSRTELDLTPIGEEAARHLGPFLRSTPFDLVAISPRLRARRTAELVGLDEYSVDPELAEWDYGEYEGRTRLDIQAERPDWSIWTHGAPGGEAPSEVAARADRVVQRYRSVGGRILLIAHGHYLRVVGARWIDQPLTLCAHLPLDTATVCVLGYDRGTPTLDRWNAAP
jgi:probable phosphoglycerate mutase